MASVMLLAEHMLVTWPRPAVLDSASLAYWHLLPVPVSRSSALDLIGLVV